MAFNTPPKDKPSSAPTAEVKPSEQISTEGTIYANVDFSALDLEFGDPEAHNNKLLGLARTLIYGPAKTRKTWWAGTAAVAGYNLFILDGENGTGILKQLPSSSYKNIKRIAVNQSATGSTMAAFLMLMLENESFIYCPRKRSRMSGPNNLDDDELYYVVDLTLFTSSDVFLVDSWTQLARDITEDFKRLYDLDVFEGKLSAKAKGSGKEDKYLFFNYSNLVLDTIVSRLNGLPCHVVLTAHRDFYTHEFKEGASKKEETHIQILSTSGNQAAKVPAAFGDVIYAELNNDGMTSTFSTKGSKTRVSGCRLVAPATHNFPPWDFGEYAKEAKLPTPVTRGPNERPPICLLTGAQIKQLLG